MKGGVLMDGQFRVMHRRLLFLPTVVIFTNDVLMTVLFLLSSEVVDLCRVSVVSVSRVGRSLLYLCRRVIYM